MASAARPSNELRDRDTLTNLGSDIPLTLTSSPVPLLAQTDNPPSSSGKSGTPELDYRISRDSSPSGVHHSGLNYREKLDEDSEYLRIHSNHSPESVPTVHRHHKSSQHRGPSHKAGQSSKSDLSPLPPHTGDSSSSSSGSSESKPGELPRLQGSASAASYADTASTLNINLVGSKSGAVQLSSSAQVLPDHSPQAHNLPHNASVPPKFTWERADGIPAVAPTARRPEEASAFRSPASTQSAGAAIEMNRAGSNAYSASPISRQPSDSEMDMTDVQRMYDRVSAQELGLSAQDQVTRANDEPRVKAMRSDSETGSELEERRSAIDAAAAQHTAARQATLLSAPNSLPGETALVPRSPKHGVITPHHSGLSGLRNLDMASFLGQFGLQQYAQSFIDNGFDDVAVLVNYIGPSAEHMKTLFNSIAMKPGHAIKLQAVLEEIRKRPTVSPTLAPTGSLAQLQGSDKYPSPLALPAVPASAASALPQSPESKALVEAGTPHSRRASFNGSDDGAYGVRSPRSHWRPPVVETFTEAKAKAIQEISIHDDIPESGFHGDFLNVHEDGTRAKYELGLFDSKRYYVRVPRHRPKHMPSEATLMWDDFSHHPGGDKHQPDQPLPPFSARLLALFLAFMLTFGASATYASVGALESYIREDYGVNDSQYSLLFAAYSLPNIVGTLFAGIICDRLGVDKTMFLYGLITFVGTLIGIIPSFEGLLAGRIIYGLGVESLGLVQNYLLCRWFAHDTRISLALSSAICLVSYRAAGFMAMAMFPSIAESSGLSTAFVVNAIMAGSSFAASIFLVVLDRKYESFLKEDMGGDDSNFKWRDLLHLSLMFWLVTVLNFSFYAVLLTYFSFAVPFLRHRFDMDDATAGQTTSYVFLTATIALPFSGFMLDRWGHRVSMMIASCVFMTIGYALLIYTTVTPIIASILLGLAYCFGPAAIWPSYAIMVAPVLQGTAFGVAVALMELSTFVYPVALAPLQQGDDLFPIMECLFISSVITTAFSFTMYFADLWKGGVLEHTVVKKLSDRSADEIEEEEKLRKKMQELRIQWKKLHLEKRQRIKDAKDNIVKMESDLARAEAVRRIMAPPSPHPHNKDQSQPSENSQSYTLVEMAPTAAGEVKLRNGSISQEAPRQAENNA